MAKQNKGTASNIEVRRWCTESKMFTNDYPVFASLEDDNGNILEHFSIYGCTTNGEKMNLRIRRISNPEN